MAAVMLHTYVHCWFYIDHGMPGKCVLDFPKSLVAQSSGGEICIFWGRLQPFSGSKVNDSFRGPVGLPNRPIASFKMFVTICCCIAGLPFKVAVP
jgi:hypothetical protein